MLKFTKERATLSTLYEPIGGMQTCQSLSRRFHDRVARDPALKNIFPKKLQRLTEHFALFIAERIGGPTTYSAIRGKQSLICRHAHLSISTELAEKWLAHMFASIHEEQIPEPAAALLGEYFAQVAKTLTDPFLPLYDLPLNELRKRIASEPALLQPAPTGHSLLREAVCRWDVPRTRFLLESGADPNAHERLGHGSLYRAVNVAIPGAEAQGNEVVRLLLLHSADVNWRSGPGKSTPLHVAARRGHVSLAQILLQANADLEAKDSKGQTPLRRAVNCCQEPMVHLLLAHGANPFDQDHHGISPASSARSETIRQAIERTANPT